MIGPQNTSPLSELHVARKGVVLVVLACLGCTRLLPTTGIEGEGATCDAVEQPAAGEGPHEEEINNDGEIDHPGEDHGAHIRLPVFDEKDACGNEEHGQKKKTPQSKSIEIINLSCRVHLGGHTVFYQPPEGVTTLQKTSQSLGGRNMGRQKATQENKRNK